MRRRKTPLRNTLQCHTLIGFLIPPSPLLLVYSPQTGNHLLTQHECARYEPTQADVAVYKAVSKAPSAEKYPHVDRWYRHIAAYVEAFGTLPGDAAKPASSYGPETATETPAAAPDAEEDDDDVDLFGSDDEEEDAEKAALTKKRLEEYAAKKVYLFCPGWLSNESKY